MSEKSSSEYLEEEADELNRGLLDVREIVDMMCLLPDVSKGEGNRMSALLEVADIMGLVARQMEKLGSRAASEAAESLEDGPARARRIVEVALENVGIDLGRTDLNYAGKDDRGFFFNFDLSVGEMLKGNKIKMRLALMGLKPFDVTRGSIIGVIVTVAKVLEAERSLEDGEKGVKEVVVDGGNRAKKLVERILKELNETSLGNVDLNALGMDGEGFNFSFNVPIDMLSVRESFKEELRKKGLDPWYIVNVPDGAALGVTVPVAKVLEAERSLEENERQK